MATCKHCKTEFTVGRNTHGIYCNNECQHKEQIASRYIRFIAGENNVSKTAKGLKTLVTIRDEYKCSCCNIINWNDKSIVLELDHIDGNHENNVSDNLRLLCPNCHSQTDTYKCKNIGNGRHYRKVRRDAGKSF